MRRPFPGDPASLARNSPEWLSPSRDRFIFDRTAVLEGFPLLPGVEDLAGRAALVLADDPVLGHEVDQPGGAAVADPQGSLEERAGAPALADHDLDGRLVEFIALFQRGTAVLAPGAAAHLELEQLPAELDLVTLQVLADAVDLQVGDIRALGADDVQGPGDKEEHIGVVQKAVGDVI